MEDIKNKKNSDSLENKLDEFLSNQPTKKEDCVGDECLINDGKEIVERVNKIYKTNDGRQLLM